MPFVRRLSLFPVCFAFFWALLSGGELRAQVEVDPHKQCKEDESAEQSKQNQLPPAIADLEDILNRVPTVTFNQHIAPIVKQHCARCHNPSEKAPGKRFPFVDAKGEPNYDLMKKFSWAATGQVMQELMPPEGRLRLTEQEKGYFKEWTLAGTPRGEDPAPTPKPGEQSGSGAKAPPCKSVAPMDKELPSPSTPKVPVSSPQEGDPTLDAR